MKEVDAWTDGSCLDNGKPFARCGAGVVLVCGDVVKELSIPLPNWTTNNQAELAATVEALKALKYPCKVNLYTDSSYVQKGITEWITTWKRNGWKTSNKKSDVKNKELWQELDQLRDIHSVTWVWVKGHADNEWNNLADRLAVAASGSLVRGGGCEC